ncbi:hypothetical protein [Neorhizobium sp. NCHU2750]|uniref:hypothetical protein n=1 Tax=Neorhizobium sp. NCHU2750 TaxID=1825976 RepID=UPI0013C4D5F8
MPDRPGLAQPVVSGMLSRLRDGFDALLFVCTKLREVSTTGVAGLAAPIRQILSDAEGILLPAVFDAATAGFHVSITAAAYAIAPWS